MMQHPIGIASFRNFLIALAGLLAWMVTALALAQSPAPTAPPAGTPQAGAPQTGSAQPQPPDTKLRQQITLLQAVNQLLLLPQADGAVRSLEQVLAMTGPDSLPGHTASLLHSDLTGGFNDRMKAWSQRRVVDVVVLVPDEASFAAAIAQWTADRFWPVLIEDDWFASLFIEAFKPAKVVRWSRPEGQADAGQMAALVAAVIKDHNHTLLKADEAGSWPGLVVIDPKGSQRMGGLALAMGRRQPIMVVSPEGDHRKPADALYINRLNRTIMTALAALKLIGNQSWCAMTLAGEFPYEFDPGTGKGGALAVDDTLGRDDQQVRRAATGRLVGPAAQSVYQAMGGLFLEPDRAVLLNTYGYNEAGDNTGYREYHLNTAAKIVGQRMPVTLLQNGSATPARFRKESGAGSGAGFYWINSAFGTDALRVGEQWLTRQDMPVGAYAMNMVASFSADDPYQADTLGAQCLAGGAYWFFGSVHEPYLSAFVHPAHMAHRAAAGAPMGFANRHVPGHPFYKPWKLMLIGDPLWTLRRPGSERVERLAPEAEFPGQVVTEQDGQGAVERFRTALLVERATGGENGAAMARAALAEAGGLTPGLVAQAARVLTMAGDDAAVVAMSDRLAAGHPVAAMLRVAAAMRLVEAKVAANDVMGTEPVISLIMRAPVQHYWKFESARQWRDAMKQAGQEAQANALLKQFADRMNPYGKGEFDKVMNRSPR